MSSGGAWMPGPSAPEPSGSSRAQRLLVRVLLALRSEARCRPHSVGDHARAEALADRIMLELPRSVLPIGLAALFIVGVVCLMPIMRDAIAAGSEQRTSTVASVVESGIRSRSAALSDGIGAIRDVVAPFAGEARPQDADASAAEAPPCDAAAPFSRS